MKAASRKRRRRSVLVGDVFVIPIPGGGFGLGQSVGDVDADVMDCVLFDYDSTDVPSQMPDISALRLIAEQANCGCGGLRLDSVPSGSTRPGAVVGEGWLSGSRARGHPIWRIIESMRSRDGPLQRWYCRKHGFDIVARVVRASAFAMQLDVEIVDERGDRRMAMDDRGDVGR